MTDIKELIEFDLGNVSDHYRLELKVGSENYLFNNNDVLMLRKAIRKNLQNKDSVVVRYSKLPHVYGFGKPLSGVLANAHRIAFTTENGLVKYVIIDKNNKVLMQIPYEEVRGFCVEHDLPIKVVLPFTL